MTFDLARILESKRQQRRALAALPIEEKLRLLDELRQRTLDLRSSEPTTSLTLHQEPAVSSQLKSSTKIARHLAENFPDTEAFPAPPPRPSSHERPIPEFRPMPRSHRLETRMTTPRPKSINTVSEPQPLGYDHSLGRYQRFLLPAISATPLRKSEPARMDRRCLMPSSTPPRYHART